MEISASDRVKIYEQTIKKFSKPIQILKACEELGELIRAISRMGIQPTISVRRNLIDELVDVQIMLEQVMLMFEINQDEYLKQYNFKLQRLKDFIGYEKDHESVMIIKKLREEIGDLKKKNIKLIEENERLFKESCAYSPSDIQR